MRPLRRWRVVVPVLLGLVLLAGAWLGWNAWQVSKDLTAAADDVETLQDAVRAGDDEASDTALADLQAHSRSAADRTGGISWSVLTKVPAFGDDAHGIRLVSEVVDDLSNDGIAPLVETAGNLEALLPTDGQISIASLRELQGPVAEGNAALAKASERLAGEDPSGYVQRFRDKYRDLSRQVRKAAVALDSADAALQMMPSMLGEGEKRDYLLIFQNNAEIRATGGLPGAVSVLEAEDGKVALTRQVAANTFGATDEPVLPMTEAEMGLYYGQIGRYFLNANLTPDFPRAAELMKARWEQVYDERIDGVVALDPVVLSYVLGVLGPVQVGDVTLTEQNAVDELLSKVYLKYEDPADQDAFFREVARTTFTRVLAGGADPQALLRALGRGAREGRVYVHSFDGAEQAALAGRVVSGELQTEATSNPVVDVALNDGTASKMSYYLRHKVSVISTSCTSAGVQSYQAKARLMSEAPRDAADLPAYITGGGDGDIEPGAQLVLVEIHVPVGGTITDLRYNGEETGLDVVQDGERQVALTNVYLEPQQKATLTWRMTSGPDQPGNTVVGVTPGVTTGSKSSVVRSSC
ncbi:MULTISPECIES: DUF4012 domain-containing protein [unclassified Nocardioides]|uniref:DUF4012 domain-containing protein n=1 Tax=unclassified Nocardioides TaxID=2615069 RepID=UPI0030145F79